MSRIYQKFQGMVSRRRIEAILESMPEELRVPLTMDDAGWHVDEIGEALGMSALEAKRWLLRARAEFRARLLANAAERPGAAESPFPWDGEQLRQFCSEHDVAAAVRGFYGL